MADRFGFWRRSSGLDKRLVDGGGINVPGEVICAVAGKMDGAVVTNEAADGGFEGKMVVFCCWN